VAAKEAAIATLTQQLAALSEQLPPDQRPTTETGAGRAKAQNQGAGGLVVAC
jgi:hypothetical protein